MTRIYHLTPRLAWQNAQAIGAYRAPSLEDEGFIHTSNLHQVLLVAERFYRDVPDLVLLVIERERVQAVVKDEAAAHPAPVTSTSPQDDTYPHIYGALNLDAVVAVLPLGKDTHGRFILPEDV